MGFAYCVMCIFQKNELAKQGTHSVVVTASHALPACAKN